MLVPLPNEVSGLLNATPLVQPMPSRVHMTESLLFCMSVVVALPRTGSFSWYVDPDWVTWIVTVPL